MSTSDDPIAVLVALEEIRRLKHAYARCLDTKDWDGLADLLLPEATASYGGGAYELTGRDAVLGFLRDALGRTSVLTVHAVGQPEIELDGPGEARATWRLTDEVIDLDHGIRVRGASFYDDRYRRVDGRWRIAHTGYRRLFEELVPRPPEAQLTASWWGTDGRSRLGGPKP